MELNVHIVNVLIDRIPLAKQGDNIFGGIRPSPGGGASQPKSVVACSKMKIGKDPCCVDFYLGFTPPPHSTHCWVTPHNSSLNGVTDKAPIPHNSSTFWKHCCRTTHSIHILCHFDLYTHITPTLTNFIPILCPHNSTLFFHF